MGCVEQDVTFARLRRCQKLSAVGTVSVEPPRIDASHALVGNPLRRSTSQCAWVGEQGDAMSVFESHEHYRSCGMRSLTVAALLYQLAAADLL